jgi:8-oxo-dGTP pyrophosphatase MutT (NUDIX family)
LKIGRVRQAKAPTKTRGVSQVAVLPMSMRKSGKLLLITSRNSKSWTLPKGNVEPNATPVQAAKTEAFEEAGVVGRIVSTPIGVFTHKKTRGGKFRVAVYQMYVQKEFRHWPEMQERQRRWVSISDALEMITNMGLKKLMRKL